eukprot:Skav216014  [mRNA]  locus=scaffold833:343710:344996:+ [translate_table: standard]
MPELRVITSGLVHGSQTAARGELTGFLRALQAAIQLPEHTRVDFVTDAKYVWDLVDHIQDPAYLTMDVNTSNIDLIEQIIPLWSHPRFQVRKVKSHRSIDSAVDRADLYDILGNACVDKAVSAILQFTHKDILAMTHRIADFHKREKEKLGQVAKYLIDLNRTRMNFLEKIKLEPRPVVQVSASDPVGAMPCKLMGDEARNFLAVYTPNDHTQFATDEIPDMECFLACQQGARLSMAVVFWLQTLLWPPDVETTQAASDWGISWLELFFDFNISTAMTFPIRVEGLKKQSKYVEFHQQEAQILPQQKRSPAYQAFCLQKMISTIETISGLTFMPRFKSGKCTSLNHLNLQGKTSGVPRRPTLRHPKETMCAISEYFCKTNGKLVQSHAFIPWTGETSVDVPMVNELPTDERCKLYQKLMKRMSRARTA